MKLKKIAVILLLVFASSAHASDVYDYAPAFSPYSAGSVKREVLRDALEELNYVRWLAGVPNNVILNEEYTRKAQHGAVLLDALDTLTHTPSRPSDMDSAFYLLGYDATTHGNLAVSKIYQGSQVSGNITLSYSTKLYMDDSDSNNISALGHRRWLMNPRLKQTGFGISTRRGYAVTYVIEEFGDVNSYDDYQQYLDWLKWPIDEEFITWPAYKHEHPLSYFDANTAWSVTLNSDVYDTCNDSSVAVKLTRMNDGRTWNFTRANSNGYFNINKESVAYDECIIFRPQDVTSYNNGETWRVEISGLTRKDGRAGTFSYSVKFTSSSTGYEEEIINPRTYTNNDSGESTECNSGFGFASLVLCAVRIPRVKRYVDNK